MQKMKMYRQTLTKTVPKRKSPQTPPPNSQLLRLTKINFYVWVCRVFIRVKTRNWTCCDGDEMGNKRQNNFH